MRVEVLEPAILEGTTRHGRGDVVSDATHPVETLLRWVANGWAKHLPDDGEVELAQGERGKADGPVATLEIDSGRSQAQDEGA